MPVASSAFTLLLHPHLMFREIPTSSLDHPRPHATPSDEDVWRLQHSQAMSTAPADESSAFTLLFYLHREIREIPTKCCSS